MGDKLCKEAAVVADVDKNTRVIYLKQQARRCLMSTARDFCIAYARAARDDGSFVIAGASVEHPKCPPRTDTVRGELSSSGWIIRPAEGGRHSHITYVVQVNG